VVLPGSARTSAIVSGWSWRSGETVGFKSGPTGPPISPVLGGGELTRSHSHLIARVRPRSGFTVDESETSAEIEHLPAGASRDRGVAITVPAALSDPPRRCASQVNSERRQPRTRRIDEAAKRSLGRSVDPDLAFTQLLRVPRCRERGGYRRRGA
jgi:hypothetical protein